MFNCPRATLSLEIHHDIEELSKVNKLIAPLCEVIIILKIHRLGPRVANLLSSPRPLNVVLSETAMHGLLMKSLFHVNGLHPNIYLHIGRPRKERPKYHFQNLYHPAVLHPYIMHVITLVVLSSYFCSLDL